MENNNVITLLILDDVPDSIEPTFEYLSLKGLKGKEIKYRIFSNTEQIEFDKIKDYFAFFIDHGLKNTSKMHGTDFAAKLIHEYGISSDRIAMVTQYQEIQIELKRANISNVKVFFKTIEHRRILEFLNNIL